ncbi:MAG: hypothetical protein AB1445_10190 [Bacillota bacterium]
MLVNQRLLMNFRLAHSSLFLGILTAFMVWSLQWALESRKEATFDMPGDVTVLRMFEGPQMVAATDAASAQEELKAYLRDRSLALIVSSYGDGRPEMLVYDPHGLLAWFPRATPEDLRSAMSGAYLFKGTYSERRWSEFTLPLLPKGVVVEGVISAPRGAGDLQYARRIGRDSLPPGNYTINTIDPTQVRHILDLLHRMGLAAQGAQRIPLVEHLILNPLLVVTVLFLVLGHVCAVLYWSLYLRGRAHEFGVRSRHGAQPLGLVRENLVGGLPGLVAGGVVGVILSGLLVAAIGHVPLTPGNFQTLAGAGVLTVVAATVTWSMTLYVVIRSR